MLDSQNEGVQVLLRELAINNGVPEQILPELFSLLEQYPRLNHGDMQELQRKLNKLISTAVKDRQVE
ncbi:MAG: hypothetical protein SWL02_17775 [Pseudomonadota bacterium]|nr:hypothetical protein [Pseudomonadota bacterium]